MTPSSEIRLHITLGDPSGIGPEILVRALADWTGPRPVIHGHLAALERAAALTGLALPNAEIRTPPRAPPDAFADPGASQIAYLEQATSAARAGAVDALCTAPINKASATHAGFTHPGHTEYLAARAGVDRVAMLFAGEHLRVLLATIHIGLARVAEALADPDHLAGQLILAAEALQRDFGVAAPRIAVCGFNPHAGEGGLFGDEEARLVVPALARARAALADAGVPAHITDPLPADGLFPEAAAGAYDLVVALYHDQGLIPIKLLEHRRAVNVTLGLPYVRTSPGHGTAPDIAWMGKADPGGMRAALDLAWDLAKQRRAGS